jgi:hypothetical protein
MYAKLTSPIVEYPGYTEQKYAIVYHYIDRWVLVEEGYTRIGSEPSIAVEYLYNPYHEGDPIEFYGDTIRVNYTCPDGYLKDCSIKERDLYEGVPCFSWAISCDLE